MLVRGRGCERPFASEDLKQRPPLNAQAGVPELWLVDVFVGATCDLRFNPCKGVDMFPWNRTLRPG